jgi:hypothetical protein
VINPLLPDLMLTERADTCAEAAAEILGDGVYVASFMLQYQRVVERFETYRAVHAWSA